MSGIITFENVSFKYEKNTDVLNNISFSINEGEKIGLIGVNGVGKSTLMKLILGIESQAEGVVSVCGVTVNNRNLKEIRKKVGYVFQDSDNQLFMHTVYDDVCFGPLNYGYSKEEVEKRAYEAMNQVGCLSLKDKAVYKLSAGEKKQAAIASILSMTPDVIVMDEPESNLDPVNRRRLINIINDLSNTCIIASHDLDFIWEVTDKVFLLGDGKINATGKTKDILSDENLLSKYSFDIPNCAIIDMLKNQIKQINR